jgi:hypothetical protein
MVTVGFHPVVKSLKTVFGDKDVQAYEEDEQRATGGNP